MENNEFADMIIPTLVGLAAGVFWFMFYVQPADEFRYTVMDCMGEDISREAYDSCVEEIRESQ